MINPAHGIEGMCSVTCSGLYARDTLLQGGVGVPDADTYSATRGIDDESKCTLQLRRNREHPDAACGYIPHLVERLARNRLQVDGGVNPAPGMAEDRTFEMNAERLRARGISAGITVRAFHSPAQIPERFQRLIKRGSDGCRTITGHSMPQH